MRALATLIDRVNEGVGRAVAWLALVMALTQFTVVVARYVFNLGNTAVQESIWYMHGIVFMIGAGYALLHNGHVRVDILYREAPQWRKAAVDLFGCIAFLLPVMGLTLYYAWSYVIDAWRVFEGSTEIAGLPGIFLLKTVIWGFAVLVGLQGISMALRALLYLTGASDSYGVGPAPQKKAGTPSAGSAEEGL